MSWLLTAIPALAASSGDQYQPHEPHMLYEPLGIDNLVVGEWLVVLILTILAILVNRVITRVPNTRIQGFFEMVIGGLEGWLAGFIGSKEEARRYMPLLGSFFLFILFSNYSGLLPTAGEPWSFFPPTGKWGTTAGLALIVMVAIWIISLKELGLKGFISHMLELHFGPLAIIMAPLRLAEEVVRPFSLSLRLFGNIMAEEILLGVMIWLAPYFVPIPIIGLSLIFGFMQALVFTTLTAIYIGGVIEAKAHLHHHDHGHEHGHGQAELAHGH